MVLACWASSFSNQHPSSLFQGFNLQPFNLTLTKVKGFQLNPCWLVVVKQICCLDVKRQFNSSMLSGFGSGNNDLYETRILSGKAKDHLSSSWFSAFFKAQPSCLSLRPYMMMCRIEAIFAINFQGLIVKSQLISLRGIENYPWCSIISWCNYDSALENKSYSPVR